MIHTGMYNKLAYFYKLEETVNSFGARGDRKKKLVGKAYVYMSNLRNSELWESRRINDNSKLRIRVRFCPWLLEVNTRNTFVEIDGVMWNVLSVENVLNRNRDFLFYLERKKNGEY